MVGLILGILGYLVANLVEGVFSGNGRFGRYGTYLGGEAVLRLGHLPGLVAVGVRTAGPYGLTLGLCPIVMAVVVLWGQRDLAKPGPEIPWAEISSALGALLVAAVLALALINAPAVLVQLLADPGRAAEVGQFTAALVVARLPFFLFQAIQAALLPKLSGLVADERYDEFRRGLRRLVSIVAALAVVATIVGFTVGSQVHDRRVRPRYDISDRTVGVLAAGLRRLRGGHRRGPGPHRPGRAAPGGGGLGDRLRGHVGAWCPSGRTRWCGSRTPSWPAPLASIVAMAVELRLQSRSGAVATPDSVLEAMSDLPLEP